MKLAELRVLRALAAGGGALTKAKIGAAAGLAGPAGPVCDALAAAGCVERHDLDLDGVLETAWRISPAGRAALEASRNGRAALPATDKAIGGVRTLVPNYGSNRLLAGAVGEALAGCAWVGIPFCGGLAELPAITARTVVANDLHGHVVNLAKVAGDRKLGPDLYRRLRRLAFHPKTLAEAQEYCRGREKCWDTGVLSLKRQLTEPCIEWAVAYFTCAWMARNGTALAGGEFKAPLSVRWNAGGGDSPVRFRNAAKGLLTWRRILARCTFTCLDAFEFLEKCKDEPGTGIYCDPPFPGPGDKYKFGFAGKHGALAKRLALFKRARVVCRFYDVPLVRRLYMEGDGWKWLPQVGRKASNALAPEVLIVNRV
jgi:DNA adenine methylase